MKPYRTLLLLVAGISALWPQNFNFLPGVTYPAGNGPLAVASGDFNGDGKLDIAVGNVASNNISIYLGKGDGSFTPGATVSLPGCLVAFVSAADFTRDGKTDLLVACQYQTMVFGIPGLGTGLFGTPIQTTLPNISYLGFPEGYWQPWAVADFNNDGIPDLAIGLVDTSFDPASSSICLLLSNGDGTFQKPVPVVPGSSAFLPIWVLAADFNRDGNQDLMVVGAEVDTKNSVEHVEVFLGSGKGTFQAAPNLVPTTSNVGASAVADLNHDGIPDVILTQTDTKAGEAIGVYLGAGDGTFKQTFTAPANGAILGLLPADLRGTGNIDLLEVIASSNDTFMLQTAAGNGDGSFQAPAAISFPSGLEPFFVGMLAGDWNGDGLIDLAFAALPALTIAKTQGSGDSLQKATTILESLPAGDLVVILNGITPAPKLALSNTQLQFAYVAGGAAPLAQSVAISNSGTGTLNWSASSDSSWLAVSPASGTGAGNLSVSVSPAGLTPATYTGHVQVAATGASGSPQTVTVTLTISAPSTAPVITGVVNGASFQPGIESGSWVTILGSNLSNTNPGRTWTAGEIVNGNLPQSLDGTSVTIDGRAAYVYYISPTQLNVQAPTDSTTGSVPVVVTNNSQTSAPLNAQLQAAAPAFFLNSGTSNAIASHYPDYALVGTSNAPAHPNDVLILWATGFGPTDPATPAGLVVTGAPSTATLPVIKVGGAQVPVTAAVLTPGSAGLYQIAIQLPSTVPTGSVAIQASVGGTLSPPNIIIFVAPQ